ncbi:type IV conjugative transfer system coupling protein TraD [Agrobacterium vitis]|nr:type IV conjugative transfer system coupling protein TraD [Allorhizobium ampelinum]MVA52801.1 type IV conjugative transfer system coupling protein TraD [Agrobacterium vitis]
MQAAVVRLERMARTMTTDARKKDTREKIELGGLIVKAGLRYEKRALLLGLLIDASRRLKGNDTEQLRLTAIGAEAFAHDGE